MTDLQPFIDHAAAAEKAELIAAQVQDIDCLLLWKAYVKRIKPVPPLVLRNMMGELALAAALAGVEYGNEAQTVLVADMVGDIFWKRLDEKQVYEWLRKAT